MKIDWKSRLVRYTVIYTMSVLLGTFYYMELRNIGDPDYRFRVQPIQKAAEQGDPGAQEMLGYMYAFGYSGAGSGERGISKDDVECDFWLSLTPKKARKNGLRGMIEACEAHMTEEQRLAVKKRVEVWKPAPK